MLQWTFVPQGAQWYNENICYRKAAQWQNENIYYRKAAKCFFIPSCPWRQHSMNMRPLWGRFLHSPTARRSIFFVLILESPCSPSNGPQQQGLWYYLQK